MPSHEGRKEDHLRLSLSDECEVGDPGFGLYRLIPEALPELSMEEIDLSTRFLGRTLAFPFLMASMTGGSGGTVNWNATLASAAGEHQVALALGSLRCVLDDPSRLAEFQVRPLAPNAVLLGNIGVWQIRNPDRRRRLLDLIHRLELDGLFVHLNVAQELVQPEGERDFRQALDALFSLLAESRIPVLIKEVGMGLTSAHLAPLVSRGVAGLDVAGHGGTSFTWIEAKRSCMPHAHDLARDLNGLGVPTAEILPAVRRLLSTLPQTQAGCALIASGGIRSGLDAAKALALGADMVSCARPLLRASNEGNRVLDQWLTYLRHSLACLCAACGCTTWAGLRSRIHRPGDVRNQ
jgi:isopentenyl-diphosphate delta-isomerase